MNLPLAVRPIAHDRLAEIQAQLQDWEACAGSVALAIQHLPDMVAEFPHTASRDAAGVHLLRARDPGALAPRRTFRAALALCDRAAGARSGRALRGEAGFVGVGRWVVASVALLSRISDRALQLPTRCAAYGCRSAVFAADDAASRASSSGWSSSRAASPRCSRRARSIGVEQIAVARQHDVEGRQPDRRRAWRVAGPSGERLCPLERDRSARACSRR